MPVIVDEVVIAVEVGNAGTPAGGAAPAAPPEDKQVIVNECVERVLEILRQKKEP